MVCNTGVMNGFNMIADIGNGTMNVMQIIDGRPLEKSLVTDKFGVSICMKEIQKELSKSAGESIPEIMIEPMLINGLQGRTDTVAKTVDRIEKQYAENILKRLIDYGYKENLVHLYVIGGGGCLFRHYSDIALKGNVTFIEDICANAKGYEYLAMQKQRRHTKQEWGYGMRKTYKCSNVKFCMDDENQRRTWEYLQGITRKDGSYGKILSDAFVAVLDGQIQTGTDKAVSESVISFEQDADILGKILDRVLERKFCEMLQELQKSLAEQFNSSLNEYVSAFHSDAETLTERTDMGGMEQMYEPELSEDMMAFAFAMGE